ncbi:hypothetical protein Pla123a_03870 [Posidoniimonas polymericola]|uniref:Uncharacterized protein n=1 Tax=Posidoniimonas polymericola TaxID=2528002 RepID=A0A5C5ZEM0_9BACT|nr:hypothetical protein [Posidoniimonas polymericola]TWT85580.1 hypothetical protein Pla123a_03870 [Posidoniimonas polymericola]
MPELTEQQKQDLCNLAAVGCRRETAARFVGRTVAEIAEVTEADPEFAVRLCRAEATVELAHMRCVQQAIRDEKNYRAAIWWLENAAPEGYLRRTTDALSRAELNKLLAAIIAAIESEVARPEERDALAGRLSELTTQQDDIIKEGRS